MKVFYKIFIFVFISNLYADLELPPYSYIITSENNKFYFKMFADNDNYCGNAYMVTDKKNDSLLWQINGWYANGAYISNDGHYLVRQGPWPISPIDSTDLAISFYKDSLHYGT